jgi:hypothetical protein
MLSISESKAICCKRVAIVLTLATWLLLFVTMLFPFWSHCSQLWILHIVDICVKAFLVSCLTCSPIALVLFVVSFRHISEASCKGLWLALAVVPSLFGLLFAIFSILPGHFHG